MPYTRSPCTFGAYMPLPTVRKTPQGAHLELADCRALGVMQQLPDPLNRHALEHVPQLLAG